MAELAYSTDLPDDLSDVQMQAVSWNEGPLLVLAGPGSGKTRVLTARIARLLRESPDRKYGILGLTFTNKAADEMRSRVDAMLSEQTGRLFLGTFHSFCAGVLRQHGTHLGIRPDFRIYSERADLDEVLAMALEELRDHGVDVGPGADRLIPVIERLRAELVAPADAPDHVSDESLAERIAPIYEAYDACLRRSNALDFPSLIYNAVTLFRRFPAFARHYQKVYPYWCIDEFQDTNSAQYELLRAMAGRDFKNLFAVADDDQLIYEWNGASHRRIEDLVKDFDPEIMQLNMNYRCPQPIVELANRLISHNKRRMEGKKRLDSGKPAVHAADDVVRLFRCESDRAEVEVIARDIGARHAGKLGHVVVLARNRRLLELARNALDNSGLPALLAQRRNEFASAPYVWLHACLRQSNQRREAKFLKLLCATFAELTGVHIDPDDVMAMADASHQDYLRQWAELASRAAEPGRSAAREVTEKLVRRTDYRGFIRFATDWLGKLARDVDDERERFPGYQEDRLAWIELDHEIMHNLPSDAPLEAFLHELDLRSKEPPPREGTVSLMTIHAAKGKEFDHVYVMGLAEDELPSYQARVKGDQSLAMEEERRSFFVAICRARETLTISYASTYRGWHKEPSRFLQEAGANEFLVAAVGDAP